MEGEGKRREMDPEVGERVKNALSIKTKFEYFFNFF